MHSCTLLLYYPPNTLAGELKSSSRNSKGFLPAEIECSVVQKLLEPILRTRKYEIRGNIQARLVDLVAGANEENVIASAFCAFFSKQNAGLLGQFKIVV